jgi:hypothetical protein
MKTRTILVPMCGLDGRPLDGYQVTINGEPRFIPSRDYDQPPAESDEAALAFSSDPLFGVKLKVALGWATLTERQQEVTFTVFAANDCRRSSPAPDNNSVIEAAARALGIDHRTVRCHLQSAAAKIEDVPRTEIAARAALVQTKTVPRQ